MSAITSATFPHTHTLLCTPRFELRLRLELLLLLVDFTTLNAILDSESVFEYY
jgi:hypothetical protein